MITFSYKFDVLCPTLCWRILFQNWQEPIAEANIQLRFLPFDTTDFPQFSTSQRSFRISESSDVGDLITTVTATSPKQSAKVTYHIAGGNIGESFTVTDSGQVKVQKALDYERTKDYVLYIEARDSDASTLSSRDSDASTLSSFFSLNIVVDDKNDNAPTFTQSYFSANVTEEAFTPQEVATVIADDADSGENGKIKYRIISGNDRDLFDIDERSGRIMTSTRLDREDQDHYVLTIAVVDQVRI